MIGGGPAAAAGKHVITPGQLRSIAFWSHDLNEKEFEQARRGIVEKAFPKGAYICHRGDRLDPWTGVASGLIKLGTAPRSSYVLCSIPFVLHVSPRLRPFRVTLMELRHFQYLAVLGSFTSAAPHGASVSPSRR